MKTEMSVDEIAEIVSPINKDTFIVFNEVIEQLFAVQSCFWNYGEILSPESTDIDSEDCLCWHAQHVPEDDGHTSLQLTITTTKPKWGITLKRSYCGLNGGVCYHLRDKKGDGYIIATDQHWIGLDAALCKMRLLAAEKVNG